MNYKKWIIGLCILNILPALSQEYNIENIHIDGYIGNRINTCIEHRVKSQNTDHLSSIETRIISGNLNFSENGYSGQ